MSTVQQTLYEEYCKVNQLYEEIRHLSKILEQINTIDKEINEIERFFLQTEIAMLCLEETIKKSSEIIQ